MTDDKAINTEVSFDIETHLKTNRRKNILRIVGLIIFNTILFSILAEWRGFKENLVTALNAQLVGVNLIGFILGSIVALLPYKGLGYNKKYLRASLLTIFVIQATLAIGLLIGALLTILALYLKS